MRVLIIDNYDSFTWNLYQYLGELGAQPEVVRNDAVDLSMIRESNPDRIVISPGPGRPDRFEDFGINLDVIRTLGPAIPVLGVCLGHQGIAFAFGGEVIRAPEAIHGKQSLIFHEGTPLFDGVPRAFEAMRYHSLIADRATLPPELAVTARTFDEMIMAVEHESHPIYGVQFHPESIGTTSGQRILQNFLSPAILK